ncbi:MAG: hypothetical protein JJT87_16630 [Halomonas sp.]|nr:hypothetical protein [Halomonas sp.]MCC5903540.1 hypothetical protein [Halomonas sp.]
MASSQVSCVLFNTDAYQVAIEAHYVQRIDSAPTAPRHVAIDTLLRLNTLTTPTSWLTLHDTQGVWQLGITGESVLGTLPVTILQRLPPLIEAHRPHPALCGLALEGNRLILLLNGALLGPDK